MVSEDLNLRPPAGGPFKDPTVQGFAHTCRLKANNSYPARSLFFGPTVSIIGANSCPPLPCVFHEPGLGASECRSSGLPEG
jgi:hypothetical protein